MTNETDVYELVNYLPTSDTDEGYAYLRNPYDGMIRGTRVLIGDQVDDDGTPLRGEHSSQLIVPLVSVESRQPLRLDPERGLVVDAGVGQ
jgi:hypothetical protein